MVVVYIARKLTEKQKRFADYYIESGNATEAYRKAGYKCINEKTYQANASRLLSNDMTREYIDNIIQKKDNKRIATQDEVLIYLTAVMRGETLSEVVVIEGTGDGNSKARRMDKAPDEKEKLKAAEMLAKRYGLDKKYEFEERKTVIAEKQAQELDDDIIYEVEEPDYEKES